MEEHWTSDDDVQDAHPLSPKAKGSKKAVRSGKRKKGQGKKGGGGEFRGVPSIAMPPIAALSLDPHPLGSKAEMRMHTNEQDTEYSVDDLAGVQESTRAPESNSQYISGMQMQPKLAAGEGSNEDKSGPSDRPQQDVQSELKRLDEEKVDRKEFQEAMQKYGIIQDELQRKVNGLEKEVKAKDEKIKQLEQSLEAKDKQALVEEIEQLKKAQAAEKKQRLAEEVSVEKLKQLQEDKQALVEEIERLKKDKQALVGEIERVKKQQQEEASDPMGCAYLPGRRPRALSLQVVWNRRRFVE